MSTSSNSQIVGKIPSFWPKRVFYGWSIVFVSFWDSMLTAGIGGYGFGVFMRHLSSPSGGLGWSRGAISWVALIRMITTLILSPVVGKFADTRDGPRIMMVIGAIIAGFALIVMYWLQSLWQFYVLFGVVWGGAMTALGGMLLGPAIVSKWFIRKRGRALAIGTMGISAGGVIAIPLVTILIDQFGWRLAWVILGIIMLTTILPLGGIFMRRSPEDVGLKPDGDSDTNPIDSSSKSSNQAIKTEAITGSYTLKQSFSSKVFWVLIGAQTLGGLSLPPVLMHQLAYMEDKGFDAGTAAAIGTIAALFAGIGKIPWGMLAERFPVRYVMAVAFVSAGMSLWILVTGKTLSSLVIYGIFYGLGMGGMPPLFNLAWASYFGRDHIGEIRGWATPLTRWTGGVSPVFAGLIYDWVGSYNIAFIVFSISWILAGIASLFAGNPKEPLFDIT